MPYSLRLFLAAGLFVFSVSIAQAWVYPALTVAGRFFSGPISTTVVWLGRAASSNPTMAKAFEWSLAAHAAVLSMVWFGDPAQTSGTPIAAKLVIPTKVDTPTANPDPKRYDDAPAGQLQPVPKTSFSAQSDTLASGLSYGDVFGLVFAAGGEKQYANSTTADRLFYAKRFSAGTVAGADYPDEASIPTSWNGGTKVWTQRTATSPAQVWNCGTSGQANCLVDVLYEKSVALSCPAQYTLANGVCTLTGDASQVKKPPETVPCEVTRTSSGSWHVDPKNPECEGLSAQIQTAADGSLRVSNGAGQTLGVTEKSNGGRRYDIQSGDSWRSIDTGAYDSAQNGSPITSITDGTGQNPNLPASGGSTGGTTGGTSGGSCGGTGQPACAIDDSGFDGKATDGDGLVQKIEDHDQSILEKLAGISWNDKHGIDWTWTPAIPRVACEPYVFGTAGHSITIDMCTTFSVIRQALGWLLYIFLAWGLFDMAIHGTTSNGGKRS